MVAFALILGVLDLAHSLVGWTMKESGRPGLCPKAHGRATRWPRLWQPREGTFPGNEYS